MASKLINKLDFLKGSLAATMMLVLAAPAMAQDYPEREITVVVPFSAGGNTDLTARIYASALSEEIGQPVVVDNQPGAGGTTGGGMVANAEPDGYTLLWSGSSLLAMAPLLYPDLSYDIATAYQPISRILTHTLVLAATPGLEVESVSDVVEMAKANPGALTFGSSGVGAIHHLTGELFKTQAGIDMLHIPYQGNGPAATDLLAGNIDLMFMGLPQALPYADGSLDFLAVTSTERDPALSDVPTMEEVGYPALDVAQSWYGVLAPAGIPDDVLEVLSEASKAAAARPEVIEAAANSGLMAMAEDPESFESAIVRTRETWADLVAKTGMTFE